MAWKQGHRGARAWVWAACALLASCSSGNIDSAPNARGPAAGSGKGGTGGMPAADGGDDDAGSPLARMPDAAVTPSASLQLSPSGSQIEVGLSGFDAIQFKASLSSGGDAQDVHYRVGDPQFGSIDPDTGAFTPSGVAGVVEVIASAKSLSASTTLTIKVVATQEGDPDADTKPAGAGGLGGVGGEGGGTHIDDMALRKALDATPMQDADLSWLYPNDHTVFPRGLPAPLLQWKHGAHAALAVKVHLEVDAAFRYDGFFGPPKALAMAQPITRLPIPQDVWKRALQSGKTLSVSLTIAAKSGNGNELAAYAPSKALSLTIAPTTLKGTVYYNSYGTTLAKNYTGARGGDGRFGGATLAIRKDSFDPTLVAGTTSDDSSGCRVCHVVSSQGNRLIAQHDDNMMSSLYALDAMNAETVYPATERGKFAWAALSPDGSLALGNAGPPGVNPGNASSLNTSALYRVSDGSVLTLNGWSPLVSSASTPIFSPDGKLLAFNLFGGAGNPSVKADGQSLVVMDFAQMGTDIYQVSNTRVVYTAQPADGQPGWPYFLPDGSGLVFELEKQPNTSNERFVTRYGSRGELWWADLMGHAHALERANGKEDPQPSAAGHEQDTTLQYEPTVAPLVAGGYAWVVFTSRRAYGNVATRGPFESDPREFDLTPSNAAGPTTKKLWVTAIDMPAKPGTDPSHPAFYLPAQELYAGNSRGFWVLDVCKPMGGECGTGDECCGGFCREVGEFGQKVCTDHPPATCSHEYEACNVDGDCCPEQGPKLQCIAHRCAQLQLL